MNRRIVAAGALFISAIVALVLSQRERTQAPAHTSQQSTVAAAQDDSGRRVLFWYDPMMPQQRFDKPGKSPFMDMQLVPKYADEATASGVVVTPSVQQNLGMRLASVERSAAGNRI